MPEAEHSHVLELGLHLSSLVSPRTHRARARAQPPAGAPRRRRTRGRGRPRPQAATRHIGHCLGVGLRWRAFAFWGVRWPVAGPAECRTFCMLQDTYT